jgi:hypothetical protein
MYSQLRLIIGALQFILDEIDGQNSVEFGRMGLGKRLALFVYAVRYIRPGGRVLYRYRSTVQV